MKKRLLNTALGFAIALGGWCTADSQTPSAFDAFEVATIKPTPEEWTAGRFYRMEAANLFVARNYTLRVLISAAFNLNPKAVIGGPSWIDDLHYDISARTPGTTRPNREEQMAMLRQLLSERFRLAFHRSTEEMPMLELTVAKGGPKLKPSTWSSEGHPEGPPLLAFSLAPDVVRVPGRYATVRELADIMQRAAFDRPVADRTGLTGRYDFDLEFAPDDNLFGGALRGAAESTKPSLFAAIQEQLGLRLDSKRGPVEVLVIDRVEPPGEN